MRILGENVWLTILFWLVVILIIVLIICCLVGHAIKKGEETEKEPEWYLREVTVRLKNYRKAPAELSQQMPFGG